MPERQTTYIPLSDLRADPANPKDHSLETIDASIGRFGVIDLIATDGRTGYLISGHGRVETFRQMRDRGDSPPDGVLLDETGGWLVPVTTGWSSRSDAEARAALIALNRTTELGGWVDDSLLGLLDSLSAEDGPGLEGVGYSEDDREVLRRLVDAAAEQPQDRYQEWADAGEEYENESGAPVFAVRVNFASEEDYEEFRRRLGYTGPRRSRTWFPEQPDLIESGEERVASAAAR